MKKAARPLDILFCTHEPFLPLSGGCTIGNLRIVQFLAARGHKVRVLSPLQLPLAQAQREVPGAELLRFEPWRMHRNVVLRFPKYAFYSLLYFFALWRQISRRRPDVLLVRNAVLGLPVLLAARLRGVKCALSYTDLLSALLGANRIYPRILIKALRAYETGLPAFFDSVMVISQGLKQALGLPEAVVTLDGADVSLFRPPAPAARAGLRRELGLKSGDKLAVFHGTVEAHHGEATLPRIVASRPELRFLIIGGGPGFPALQRRLAGLANARVLPFQPPAEVARLAGAADIGLVPYEPNEGLDLVFTLKLLEYFALGLPVVCFRLRSAEAAFKGEKRLLTSDSEAAFSLNIAKALKLKPSPSLRARIRRDFSWEAVSLGIARALESL